MPVKQKIKTYLWFDGKAEEAATLYTSIFKDSRISSVSSMIVSFQLAGQEFIALNGGPRFQFTEAISLLVDCETQAEVDEYWSKLTAGGGQESQCGWLKDKYGLSWQIIPSALPRLLQDEDPQKSKRVMEAMLEMKKIDVAALERAYHGKP